MAGAAAEARANDSGEEDAELQKYVVQVLQEKSKGDCSHYDNFMIELRQLSKLAAERRQEDQKKFYTLIKGLVNSAGSVDLVHHKDLCQEILGIKVQKYPMEITECLMNLLVNLTWAQPSLVLGSLICIIVNIVPFDVAPKPLLDKSGKWKPPNSASKNQEIVLEALGKVLEIAPSSIQHVLKLVQAKAPFPYRPCDAHGMYMLAISRIMSFPYASSIKNDLLEVAISHVLNMDVEFGDEFRQEQEKDKEGKEDESGEADINDLITDEMFKLDILDHGDLLNSNKKDTAFHLGKMNLALVERAKVSLDMIMDFWMGTFEENCKAGQTKEVWAALKKIFDLRIVNSNNVRCTPFLIFHLCIQDAECAEDFVEHCMNRVMSPVIPPPLKCSYISYLSSFLARFAPMSAQDVMPYVVGILEECEKYARLNDEEAEDQVFWTMDSEAGSKSRHDESPKPLVYYTMIQGIMYVLCYRMQEIAAHPDGSAAFSMHGLRDLVRGRLGPLLHHSLNPLNACSAAVAVQFAHQAHVLGLLECMDLINVDHLHWLGTRVTAFFPFDPYPLPRSSRRLHLSETYIKWKDKKMDVRMEDVLKPSWPDGGRIDKAMSNPQDIPKQKILPEDPTWDCEDFSFSAGRTPMSIGTM